MRIAKNLLAALLALGLLSASTPESRTGIRGGRQQERPLRHEAAAVVKLVPVRVLGPAGRPVMDLRKEDFTLYEDGEKKTVTEFEVHTITEAGMVVAPELPMAVKSAEVMNRKFFLFLDVVGDDPEGRQKAVAVAQRFLDTELRPGDEVGLLGFYSMSGFFIKEYLTTDIARVRRAVADMTETPTSPGEWVTIGMGGIPERFRAPNAPPDIPGVGDGTSVSVFIPGSRAFARADFVDRLKDVAEVFKTIPGSKSLVLFTSRSIGPEVGRLFGATGTAIYAVNTQDWWAVFGAKVKHIWSEHPLKEMAEASGGKYFADINQVATVAQDIQDLSGNFYVLGYYVKESWEGKYHKIRVEVARSDSRVLVQDGYADAKPFARMTDFEKNLQLLDLLQSDRPASGALPVALDPLVAVAAPNARVCLMARLEVGAVSGPPAAKSEIVVLLRDKTGTEGVSRRWTVDLGPYDNQVLFPYLVAGLPPGASEARLVVRDLTSGEACVGRVSFEVFAAPQGGIVLLSPLLLEMGAEAAFLKLPVASKGKEGAKERSLIDFYRLIPKGCHPVVSEVASGTEKLTLILPFEMRPPRPEERPILSVEAKLVSRTDGHEIPLSMKVRDERTFEGSHDILVAEIAFPAVQPGAYDFEIAIHDLDSGSRGSVRKPLVFR